MNRPRLFLPLALERALAAPPARFATAGPSSPRSGTLKGAELREIVASMIG